MPKKATKTGAVYWRKIALAAVVSRTAMIKKTWAPTRETAPPSSGSDMRKFRRGPDCRGGEAADESRGEERNGRAMKRAIVRAAKAPRTPSKGRCATDITLISRPLVLKKTAARAMQ